MIEEVLEFLVSKYKEHSIHFTQFRKELIVNIDNAAYSI
jgi:hypothetical protein